MVSGSPTFTRGDTVVAQAEILVTAPVGTPHTFANPGDQPGVIFCTVTPDVYINYFRELANLRSGPSGLDPKESPR